MGEGKHIFDLKEWYLAVQTSDRHGTYYNANGRTYNHDKFKDGYRIHTSAVKAIDLSSEKDTILLHTHYSVYRLKLEDHHAEHLDDITILEEYVGADEGSGIRQKIQDLLQANRRRREEELRKHLPAGVTACLILNMSSDAEYYFRGMLVKDGDNCEYSENYHVHVGMFQDSVLLGLYANAFPSDVMSGIDLRFFPYELSFVEFYSWDIKGEVYCLNSGQRPLQLNCPEGKFRIPGSSCILLDKKNTAYLITEDTELPVDRHNIWEVRIGEDGMLGYGGPKTEDP